MHIRYASHPNDVKNYSTERLREEFLMEKLMVSNQFSFYYSHFDRMVTGGVVPVSPQTLPTYDALKADYFLQRREMGIINIGNTGTVTVDGEVFLLEKKDCLYIGLGNEQVRFASNDSANPAKFVMLSCPAHRSIPTQKMASDQATPTHLGTSATANERTIYKYIHADGLQSCQLVMGLTVFAAGSLWNTMPPHTHDRRMESYIYFDIPEEQRVVHLMGQPQETRHLFVASEQGIISPPWSIHCGVGTASYSFIWAMAGENYTFTDMDAVVLKDMR